MIVKAHRLRPLLPPQDSLKDAFSKSDLSLKDGDILVISSKVVSIDEGMCTLISNTDKNTLIKQEADWFYNAPKTSKWRHLFTITKGAMSGSAGIDESNGNKHYVLYPKDPFKSAKRLRHLLMKMYRVKQLAVVITDSTSIPLRRGAIGFALAWDGIDPLRDYRGTLDIFGRKIQYEMANLIDAIAAAAVLEMGEGDECLPVVIIRDLKNIVFKNRSSSKEGLIVEPENDVFAPLFWRKGWKKGL